MPSPSSYRINYVLSGKGKNHTEETKWNRTFQKQRMVRSACSLARPLTCYVRMCVIHASREVEQHRGRWDLGGVCCPTSRVSPAHKSVSMCTATQLPVDTSPARG